MHPWLAAIPLSASNDSQDNLQLPNVAKQFPAIRMPENSPCPVVGQTKLSRAADLNVSA
jgi:hypothetical protein